MRVFFEAASVVASSLALLAVTTGGCSPDASGEPAGVPADEPLDTSQAQQTNVANSQSLHASPCEDFGTLAGNALTAKVTDASESFLLPLMNRPVTSRLGVLATGSATDLVGNTVGLGSGANANYETCTHCLAVAVGCGTDCREGTWFYPRSGSATFSSLGPDTFKGHFDDVVLEQVGIDWSTMHSTPTPGGACIHVQQLTFSAAVTLSSSSSGSGGLDGGTTIDDGGSSSTSSTSTSGTSGTSSGGTPDFTSSGTGDTSSGGTFRAAKDKAF